MLYIYHSILLLIIINTLITLSLLIIFLIRKITVRYTHVMQYKITNWLKTLSCTYIYILVLIAGLYCLRLSKIKRVLYLKIIYNNVDNIIFAAYKISYIYTILISFILVFIIINIILSILIIFKNLNNQLYNLYLFIIYNPVEHERNYILGYKLNKPDDYFIIFSQYLNIRLAYYKK